MIKTGVFGGAFNPPTNGHADVIAQCLPHFDQIVLVPSVHHAFGKSLIALEHRLAMMRFLIEPWPEKVAIENIEPDIQRTKPKYSPIYTIDVLKALESKSKAQLSFIIGPDNAKAAVWKKFYQYEQIEKQWSIFKVQQNVAVHSSDVRALIKDFQGDESTLRSKLSPLVDEKVINYILAHELYIEVV